MCPVTGHGARAMWKTHTRYTHTFIAECRMDEGGTSICRMSPDTHVLVVIVIIVVYVFDAAAWRLPVCVMRN